MNWTDDCGGVHGVGEEYWGDPYVAYLGYTQCAKGLGWGRRDVSFGEWGWKGKGNERGTERGKEKGKISGNSKGKGIGEGKKALNQEATDFAEGKVEEAKCAAAFTAQDVHSGGAGSFPSTGIRQS